MLRHRTRMAATMDAPPARVWEAWTVPEQWDKWFTSGSQIDLHVGGRYANADKDSGEYMEIVKHRLLRFTWENPHHQPGSIVTLRFSAARNGRCRLELSHSRLALPGEAKDLKAGWGWALASLKSFLATGNGIGEAQWEAMQKDTAGKGSKNG
jgi:uncharacterized protein YndB with AHSA1/START domain